MYSCYNLCTYMCAQVQSDKNLDDIWIEQRVGGYPTYHRIVASDNNPPKHKLTHTVKENEDCSLLVDVLGKHLHSTTTPGLKVLDKLPRHTSLQRKVKIIDNLKFA